MTRLSIERLLKWVGFPSLVVLAIPGSIMAQSTLSFTDTVFNATIVTPTSGAALDSLPPGTSVTVTSGSFSGPEAPPPTDQAGFSIGGGVGSGYLSFTENSFAIGTNSLGQVTSWSLSYRMFASYPAF